MGEDIKDQLLELAREDENNICADCGEANPLWASANLGLFICINCASIHRALGVHVSRVKSIMLDTWRAEEYEVMKQGGNRRSNEVYEGSLGSAHPIRSVDSVTLREQWIRAKYVRKLYQRTAEDKSTRVMQLPTHEGWMTKKGDIVKNWKRRYFKLSGTMLFYFKKQQDPVPKGIVCMVETVSPPDCVPDPSQDRPFCFSVNTPGREYQFSAENGEEMYDWVQILRASRTYLMNPSQNGYSVKAKDIAATQLDLVVPELFRLASQKCKAPNGKIIGGSVYGAQVVDTLVHSFQLESRQEAIQLGQQLLEKGLLKSTGNEGFSDLITLFKVGD